MADDLFRPTVTAPPTTNPPWRVYSMIYPAFFGGALTATVLGLLNGRRLALTGRHLAAIGGAGVLVVATRFAVGIATGGRWFGVPAEFFSAAAGLLVWFVISKLQMQPFRAFELRGGDPAPLWWPGLAAVVGLGFLENLAINLAVNL